MENQENSSPLPSDILAEIFLLLPLQSVLKCKIVSKAWKNVIEDPLFVKLYKVESTSFILQGNALSCLFFRGNDDAKSCIVRGVPVNLENENIWRHYLCSHKSNKVVCVKYTGCCFHLYNLLTGDVREIDDAPNRYMSRSWLFYGFGYDSHEDDYKILLVSSSKHLYMRQLRRLHMSHEDIEEYKSANCKSVVFVYSYRNRGWQTRKGFQNHLDYKFRWYNKKTAFYLNGHLHYSVTRHHAESAETPLVAAFNVHDYRLTVFAAPPPPFSSNNNLELNLTELDGCLCCTEVHWDTMGMDVWVMKEYGVAESWTKLFTLDLSRFSSSTWSWFEKLFANVELHKCQDEREMLVVFQQEYESKRVVLLRYAVEDNGVMRFTSQQIIKQPGAGAGFVDKLILFGREILCLHNR